MAGVKGMAWKDARKEADRIERKVLSKLLNNLRTDLDGVEAYLESGDIIRFEKQLDKCMDSYEAVMVMFNLYIEGKHAEKLVANKIDPDKLIEV